MYFLKFLEARKSKICFVPHGLSKVHPHGERERERASSLVFLIKIQFLWDQGPIMILFKFNYFLRDLISTYSSNGGKGFKICNEMLYS